MQVDGEHPVHAGARQHVRDQLGGDRDARRARATILPRVAEVRHHRGDAAGRRAAAGVHHHQQFHQVVVGRRARGLHDEHVAAAHVLHQLDRHLAVAEAADVRAPQRHLQVTGDVEGQLRIRVAREHRHRRTVHRGHSPISVDGWGGRIRTSEWRDQNPLPYRLATPQRNRQRPDPDPRCSSWSLATSGERLRPRTTYPVQRRGRRSSASRARTSSGMAANTHEPVPVSRARRELREPVERFRHCGKAPPHDRLAVVATTRQQEIANCDCRGIPCQFRGFEDLGGADRRVGPHQQEHRFRQLERRSAARRRPRAQAERPWTNTGTSAPSARPSAASSSAGRSQSPEFVERDQHGRRIGAATPDPALHGQPLDDLDGHSRRGRAVAREQAGRAHAEVVRGRHSRQLREALHHPRRPAPESKFVMQSL